MICFDVFVNGEKICRAGKEDLSILSCILSFARQNEHYEEDEFRLHVGGLFQFGDARVHPTWARSPDLKPGDEVSIRIIEGGDPDEPSGEVAYTAEDDRRQERAYFDRMRAKFEGYSEDQ